MMIRSRRHIRSSPSADDEGVGLGSSSSATNYKGVPTTCNSEIHGGRAPTLFRMTAIALLGILLSLVCVYGLRHCIATAHHRTALEAAKLVGNISGKVFVITGGYSGIGAETAKAILTEGGRVVIGGRSANRLEEFTASLTKAFPSRKQNVDGFELDLSDLASVQKFASYVNDRYDKIVLINNAGIVCPASVTKQGFEMQMGTMVIGHFLLSKLLLSKTTRQVWLSSTFHTMVRLQFAHARILYLCDRL